MLEEQYKPPRISFPDVSKFTAVFLGTPNWWGSMSSPVRTFVASGALDGKRVIPFITHRGSRWGNFPADLKKACPKSEIAEGMALWGDSVKGAFERRGIAAWAKKYAV